MKQYRLTELCNYVQEAMEDAFPSRYWVRAEIASLSVRGHCYMELVEKAEDGILAAKLRATCWSNVYNMISAYFAHETGQSLHVGMQVLLEVSVEFHAVYGLSLNIWNIDPTYTLGDLAKQRQMTIEQLKKDVTAFLGRAAQINVLEIKQPDADAQLVAENIAQQLEKRISFRRALKQAQGRAMKLPGVKGIKTSVSGRLGGADIARTEHYHEGSIPLQTLRANIDYGFAEAKTTFGRLGVKVWIYKGQVLPTAKKVAKTEGGK